MDNSMTQNFDSKEFRHVLGHYPTGVCAVTAVAADMPLGLIVGSFTSASLDPPLVAFFPDKQSSTWPKIETEGRFCINILSEHQNDVCKAIAAKSGNKFEKVTYRRSSSGMPIVDGCVAWIDCDLHAVLDAGDHYIVLGRVHSLHANHMHRPLLFFQGTYGQFSPLASAPR